jgi:hypothetical protein
MSETAEEFSGRWRGIEGEARALYTLYRNEEALG